MTKQQLIEAIQKNNTDIVMSNYVIANIDQAWPHERFEDIDLADILSKCARATCTSLKEALSSVKNNETVRCRQLFIYHMYSTYGRIMRLVDMGKFLNRDHTTIIHSKEKVFGYYETKDTRFMTDLSNLHKILNGQSPNLFLGEAHYIQNNRPYLLDKKTGEKFNTIHDLAKGLGISGLYTLKDIRRKFGNDRIVRQFV